MKRFLPWLMAGVLLTGATAMAGCSSDADDVESTANNAAATVKKETRDLWATWSTDGQRLVDDVQTRKDPEAKKKLLDNCRNTEEKIKKEDADNGKRVTELCDKIRDADVNNVNSWNDIKNQMTELNNRFKS